MKLEIYRPVISHKITQGWGENKACIYPNGKIVGKRGGTCPSGSQDFYKSIGMLGHNGFDLSTHHGEPVYHAGHFDGRMSVEKDRSGGIGVDITSLEPLELADGTKEYIKLRYWHLKAPVGHDGKIVKMGEQIGLADNTGASSGDHLHFGAKKTFADGRPKNRNNGYNGAFDLTPYCDYSMDAKTKAEYLYQKAPVISEQERKEMLSQLSLARQLLNLLLELKRRM